MTHDNAKNNVNSILLQNIKHLLGPSWYDAEAQYRTQTSRDSFTRILFVGLLDSTQLTGSTMNSTTTTENKSNTHLNNSTTTLKKQSYETFNETNQLDGNSIHPSVFDPNLCEALMHQLFIDQDDDNDKILHDPKEKKVTGGIFVVYPSDEDDWNNHDNNVGNTPSSSPAILGLLEAPPKSMFTILQNIRRWSLLKCCRILLASEDCPQRDFDNFGIYSTFNMLRETHVDLSEEGEIHVVDRMLRSICEEAKHFPLCSSSDDSHHTTTTAAATDPVQQHSKGASQPNKNNNQTMDNIILSGKQRKSIPSYARISACAMSDYFTDIEEFLDIFTSPAYLEHESERVHPIETTISYNMYSDDWCR